MSTGEVLFSDQVLLFGARESYDWVLSLEDNSAVCRNKSFRVFVAAFEFFWVFLNMLRYF